MTRSTKLLAFVAVLALAVSQLLVAGAAPLADPLVGTIDSIAVNGNVVTVVYTDNDASPVQHTVQLTLSAAVSLGLVSVDALGNVTILAGPGAAIDLTNPPDPCVLPDGAGSVGGGLTGYFCGSLAVDYATIMAWHDAGYGFGVMSQALFMAQKLGGNFALAEAILTAKSAHDYSALISDWGVPEEISNWGQLKKYLMSGETKSLTNLGAIMSGRVVPATIAASPTPTTSSASAVNPAGNEKGKSDQSQGSSDECPGKSCEPKGNNGK